MPLSLEFLRICSLSGGGGRFPQGVGEMIRNVKLEFDKFCTQGSLSLKAITSSFASRLLEDSIKSVPDDTPDLVRVVESGSMTNSGQVYWDCRSSSPTKRPRDAWNSTAKAHSETIALDVDLFNTRPTVRACRGKDRWIETGYATQRRPTR